MVVRSLSGDRFLARGFLRDLGRSYGCLVPQAGLTIEKVIRIEIWAVCDSGALEVGLPIFVKAQRTCVAYRGILAGGYQSWSRSMEVLCGRWRMW